MTEIKIPQEALNRIAASFETEDAKGMIRLAEIIKGAADDPIVTKSSVASGMIEIFLEALINDNIRAQSPDEPFERLLKFVESHKQKERAASSRNRKPDPAGGKAFVATIKKHSNKRAPHLARKWLEDQIDKVIDDFDVLKIDSQSIRYKYAGAERSINTQTFDKYWKSALKK